MLEDLDQVHGWAPNQLRRAAILNLRSNARDWRLGQGIQREKWYEWREEFIRSFGKTLTIKQWSRLVRNLMREEGKTLVGYSHFKLRLIRRCSVPTTEVKMIRHLILGINDTKGSGHSPFGATTYPSSGTLPWLVI